MVFAYTRHSRICWKFRGDICVLVTLCPFRSKSPVTEVTPLRVTAGHHTNDARRAETVIVPQSDSWRYSRNYGYLLSRQRHNGLCGLNLWRQQLYAKYEISMSYRKIQANNVNRDESPRGWRDSRQSRKRLATTTMVTIGHWTARPENHGYCTQVWDSIANCTLKKNVQWNSNQNAKLSIRKIAYENAACKMAAFLILGNIC